ncbi:hypothetical protein K469DRAFT_687843 [Zopfia rhizophila CBS 207.26]|uniref:Uncharacterized protein n=1 Tax=Zopfia rhizophila CBS 207.26 TaxID=1314779 RepID=A0A6A6E0N0_9PEZI|nr:hypothetical protein K469DRAFT_687843 [Zopfia rhizophila CBS 207.26]
MKLSGSDSSLPDSGAARNVTGCLLNVPYKNLHQRSVALHPPSSVLGLIDRSHLATPRAPAGLSQKANSKVVRRYTSIDHPMTSIAATQPEGGVATGAPVHRCVYPPFTHKALKYTNSPSGNLDQLILTDPKWWYDCARQFGVDKQLEGYQGIVAYHQFGVKLLAQAWCTTMDDCQTITEQGNSLQQLRNRLLRPKRQQTAHPNR